MARKISVKAHKRKGTYGVKQYTRSLPDASMGKQKGNFKPKCKKDMKKYHRERYHKKYQNDPMFKFNEQCRDLIYKAIVGENDGVEASKLLGCGIVSYKKYIKCKFKNGMSWENYGEWHIDHIIPKDSANNKTELIKLYNYKNTQPLWATENKEKKNKILKKNGKKQK